MKVFEFLMRFRTRKSLLTVLPISIIALAIVTLRGSKGGIFTQRGLASRTSAKELKVSPQILETYAVRSTALTIIDPSEEVLLVGKVQLNPTQFEIVTARAQGRISSILSREAETVKKDQVLAIIQSTELAQAEANHLKTLNHFELVREQKERSQQLFEHEIVSKKEHSISLMEYKSAKAELQASRILLSNLGLSLNDVHDLERSLAHSGDLPIRSPMDGIVIECKFNVGQHVKSDDPIFTVGSVDPIWIVLDVYEKDVSALNDGDEVEIYVPIEGAKPRIIKSQIKRISHVIDATTRSAKVWLEIENDDHSLRIGQIVSARIAAITSKSKEKLSVVPIEAVHQIEGKSIVFVQTGATTFEPREVEIGWKSDKWNEIKSGVKQGEQVVTEGSFMLKSDYLRF